MLKGWQMYNKLRGKIHRSDVFLQLYFLLQI